MEEEEMKMTAINDDPILLSLLYDMDLMPEQVKEGTHNWVRMQIIVQHWKLKSSESKEVKKCVIERESGGDNLKLKDLQSQLEDYRKALALATQGLKDVIDPYSKIKREMKEDYIINGEGMLCYLKSVQTYKDIAKEALDKIPLVRKSSMAKEESRNE